jgi:hypothetical protein
MTMPKPEIRMTKSRKAGRNPKSETDIRDDAFRASGFGLLSDFVIRHSDFARVG